jgi:hypothetical protein
MTPAHVIEFKIYTAIAGRMWEPLDGGDSYKWWFKPLAVFSALIPLGPILGVALTRSPGVYMLGLMILSQTASVYLLPWSWRLHNVFTQYQTTTAELVQSESQSPAQRG